MPRRPREQQAGEFYHVTARGNRRQVIFEDADDYVLFTRLVALASRQFDWAIHGFCLMPNHFHLVIRLSRPTLSIGMHKLNGNYARTFNERRAFDGHLFGGRFFSVQVKSDWHLLELSRYLALNPVRAGLCSTPAGWRWSSYRYLADPALIPPRYLATGSVLARFGREPAAARAALRRFVEEGMVGTGGSLQRVLP
jgi:putative transposase